MNHLIKKRSIVLFILLIQIYIFCLVFGRLPDNKLHVVVCDVGQGDAILLSYGYHQMLIDGGRDETILSCLNRHLPLFDRTIDVVVATHADADHIGGLDSVLTSFKVKRLVTTPQIKQTDDFLGFWRLVQVKEKQGMNLSYACIGQIVWKETDLLGEVVSTSGSRSCLLAPTVTPTEKTLSADIANKSKIDTNYNNGSIVILLQFKQHKFLFTGDLEKVGELALIHSGLLSKINVLKVGHHGSKSSSSQAFLHVLKPELSLISVGLDNHYGHPSSQVIKRLLEVDSKIYRTDRQGTIEVISNGRVLKVRTNK